jgi:hypothetical protein
VDAGILDKETHEAYSKVEMIGADGKPKLDGSNKPMTQLALKNDYHIATYDELYLWAIQRAAEQSGITQIIAIKSFVTTTTTRVGGIASARQDVTLTVYGEKSPM